MIVGIVGCKIDIENERKVTFDVGKNFAEENDLIFLETSSKTGVNINEIFKVLGIYTKISLHGPVFIKKINFRLKIFRNVRE